MSLGMNGDYVSGGARLSYSDAGEGLPVVLLHPTPLNREYWRPLTRDSRAFAPSFPICADMGNRNWDRDCQPEGLRVFPARPC